jgi:hypothetical protein
MVPRDARGPASLSQVQRLPESQNNYSGQSALLEKMTTPLPTLHAGLLVMLVA